MGIPPGPQNGAPLGGTQFLGSPAFSGYLTSVQPFLQTGVAAAIPIDVLDSAFPGALFDHTLGQPEVTVKATGRYRVDYVGGASLANNNRSESSWHLALDEGAGFGIVNGTNTFVYHRNISTGSGQGTSWANLALAAGDQVRLEGLRVSGTGDLAPLAFTCRLAITRLSS